MWKRTLLHIGELHRYVPSRGHLAEPHVQIHGFRIGRRDVQATEKPWVGASTGAAGHYLPRVKSDARIGRRAAQEGGDV